MNKIPFLLILILLISSAYRISDSDFTGDKVAVQISLPTGNGSGAYLTEDHHGNPVLSWVQQISSKDFLMYYAVSMDGGHSFGKAKSIPTSRGIYPHDENLSKIIYKKNGDMMAVFAVSNPSKDNKYAGLLYYTQSFDHGTNWTKPEQLSPAKSSSNDERYFDMTLLPDGEIGIVWLDSRKAAKKMEHSHVDHEGMDMMEGSSIYFSRTAQKQGFSEESRIAESTCQCCRTKLYTDQAGKLHLTYRAILNDSIRDMVHTVSLDNGKTFSKPNRISPDDWVIRGCPHTGPTMTGNQMGMHFAWYTMGNGKGIFYCNSADGKSFTNKESISASATAKHPQMTATKTGELSIVWDELTEEGNYRIGMQARDVSGKLLKTEFLTDKNSNATHPVALACGNKGLIVAYTRKTENKNQVFYSWKNAAE